MKASSNFPTGGAPQAQPPLVKDTPNEVVPPQSAGCAADGLHLTGEGRDGGRAEDQDYYVNDAGLVVFTSKYLLGRGYCCGNGCKHCPYDYEAVPEPARALLLAERNKHEF